ncbi:MAG: PQQ-binding-like beta-propeller repeat protein [Alphaproteobacteria bacterium]|nr:PQQ-binding-like beta-propeller repeat protein [Alphaproteobacteria bacterium]
MKAGRFHGTKLAAALLLVALSGCHTLFGSDDDEAEKTKNEGKRVAILELSKKPEADSGVSDVKFTLPSAVANKDWPQAGGNPDHAPQNLALAEDPEVQWTASIGDGSSKYYKLLARPVVSGGKAFTLDSRGVVAAFDAGDGDRLWRFDTTPEDRSGETMGGGVGVEGDVVYVTTGFGEVLALKAGDGVVLWRKNVGKPLRAAPTIASGRVFVVTIDNELKALSLRNGEILWQHGGITESATLMGASNPAAEGDSVVVAYSSGEIFSLRAQNGRVAWADVLAVPEKVGALPAIADIRGLPVIEHGRVFAVSHSGRMASVDQRTGDRAWDADIGGVNTPLVAGDAVFVLSNNSELIALTRSSGRIVWVKELQRLKDPDDRDSTPVLWWGPVLAGGRLWLTNSLGHLAAFSPGDGAELVDRDVGKAFYMPPIVADHVMYLLSDNGRLMALK